MDAFFGTFKTYERTIGVTLYSQLKQDAVYAKVRKYPDSITRALDRNNIPVAVFDTLIARDQRQPADAAPLLPAAREDAGRRRSSTTTTSIRRSCTATSSSRSRAAASSCWTRWRRSARDYVAALTDGLRPAAGWTPIRARSKQSGAHMDGYAYDVHPYVLMNYNDDYESVTTLAHEWGHAMHSYLANKAQPFVTSNYADLHRRDRVDVQRGAAARARAEDGEDRRRAAATTSAPRSSSCAARSSARRCSPSSSATSTRASTRASR